ncbi:D-alanine--D-alanine ligase [Arsenophonus symbiont of Ornithomya chloropus]|uniref:D-alanine--D-alanine ligase n=1 Tax=Arsenophonus symbiont of Ornithomya chloropus TaxID=634121 RepID=UPI0032B1B58A
MDDKVAVLLGGNSSERIVSLESGKAVVNGLINAGVDAYPVDIKNFSLIQLKKSGYTKVFIALHGRGGEDGTIQGVLEYLRLPYTGSGILASSLSIDKMRTKQLWSGIGLPVIPSVSLYKKKLDTISDEVLLQFVHHLGFPIMVKPNFEGSSIGISKVKDFSELRMALEAAFFYDENVLIEKYLYGEEYTVAILGDLVLPIIRIQSKEDFYDYNAKYFSNETQYFCPSGLTSQEELRLNALALNAYQAIGCMGCARIDLIKANDGFYLLEINTSPGMTDHSLVPLAAKQAGFKFSELVKKLLDLVK